jgi:hypothetical protein
MIMLITMIVLPGNLLCQPKVKIFLKIFRRQKSPKTLVLAAVPILPARTFFNS